jgi:hypothetical protein
MEIHGRHCHRQGYCVSFDACVMRVVSGRDCCLRQNNIFPPFLKWREFAIFPALMIVKVRARHFEQMRDDGHY